MVEKSEEREHIWQVAGDVIQGIPDTLSSAERALDRTSYALSVMGEDFLRGRLSFDDRARVDGAVKTSPFSGNRGKDSMASRVARRYLLVQGVGGRGSMESRVSRRYLLAQGVAPSAEAYFFHNPEMREVRQLSESKAISNDTGVAVNTVKGLESPDRTVSKARSESNKAPPTPDQIKRMPGGAEFSTLNRFLVETGQPGVHGVPEGHWEVPKHPKLKR
jgi:hypothetical protein